MSVVKKFWLTTCLILVLLGAVGRGVAGEEPEKEKQDARASSPPIVVFNVASIDRVMEDIEYVFGSVDREDMTGVVEGLLEDVGDFQGVSHDKPLGMMLYLEPGLRLRPAMVVYAPVEDISSVIETIGTIGGTAEKSADDRYQLTLGQKWFVELRDGYAFAARDEATLKRELPDPSNAFTELSKPYGIALDIRPASMQPAMRTLIFGFIQTRADAEMRQREDESDVMHALRKAQGMSNLQLVERFLTQTRSVTIGLNVSREKQQAIFEVVIDAAPGSPFLEALQALPEEASRFAPILDEPTAIVVSLNAKIDEQTVQAQSRLLEAAEAAVGRALTRIEPENPAAGEEAKEKDANGDATGADDAEENQPADQDKTGDEKASDEIDPAAAALAEQLFDPLHRLLETRNLDGFAQLRAVGDEHYVLIGALEVPRADELTTPVRKLIDRLRESLPRAAATVRVEYGAARAGEVPLHRLTPTKLDPKQRRVYGEDFAIYFGFGENAVWVGIGGTEVVPLLEDAISQTTASDSPDEEPDAVPFRMTVQASRLLGLAVDKTSAAIARDAFSAENDAMRIEFRPTDTGGRLRVELEEGFIRLLGLGVSKRYDES